MEHNESQENTDLTYDNILRILVNRYKNNTGKKVRDYIQGTGYYAQIDLKNGYFIYIVKDDQHRKVSSEGGGLKFHISIDPNRFAEGLNIVAEILRKHGVLEFKFPNPLIKDSGDNIQEPGKEICIYAFLESDRPILNFSNSEGNNKTSWEEIIGEITKSLYDAEIKPGALARTSSDGGLEEQEIPHALYVSWREDHKMHDEEELVKLRIIYANNFAELDKRLQSRFEGKVIAQERLDSTVHIEQREQRYQEFRESHKLRDDLKFPFEKIKPPPVAGRENRRQIQQPEKKRPFDLSTHVEQSDLLNSPIPSLNKMAPPLENRSTTPKTERYNPKNSPTPGPTKVTTTSASNLTKAFSSPKNNWTNIHSSPNTTNSAPFPRGKPTPLPMSRSAKVTPHSENSPKVLSSSKGESSKMSGVPLPGMAKPAPQPHRQPVQNSQTPPHLRGEQYMQQKDKSLDKKINPSNSVNKKQGL